MLALLLVNANQPLSTDLLIDGLWEERPPAERGQDGSDLHLTLARSAWPRADPDDPGRLHAAGRIGRARRESLRAACGRGPESSSRPVTPLARRSCCRKRLDLWRGEALADFRFNGFAQAEIGRLQERRASAVADRVDARLALGRAEEVIPELEALIREQPVSERPRRQLMLALYQAGRQADALDAYQAARSALVEELGIEPSRSLRELHQQILSQDPALDLAGPPDERHSQEALRTLRSEPRRRAGDAGGAQDRSRPSSSGSLSPPSSASASIRRRSVVWPVARSAKVRSPRNGTAARSRPSRATRSPSSSGCRLVHEDDALRAVRAAVELREALVGLAEELAAERADPARLPHRDQHRRGRHGRRLLDPWARDRRAAALVLLAAR